MYETDGISSELHLWQNGKTHVHVKERSEHHIREVDGTLTIYVPRDPNTQAFCYFSILPSKLLEWMLTCPDTLQVDEFGPEAVQIMTSVLNAPLMSVSQILEAGGIIEVDVPEGGDETDYDTGESDAPAAQYADAVSSPRQETSVPPRPVVFDPVDPRSDTATAVPRTPSGQRNEPRRSPRISETIHPPIWGALNDGVAAGGSNQPASRSSFAFDFTPPRFSTPQRPLGDSGLSSQSSAYIKLLSHVIGCARKYASPSQAAFNLTSLANALPGGSSDRGTLDFAQLSVMTDRDKKIGAAGELFVSYSTRSEIFGVDGLSDAPKESR